MQHEDNSKDEPTEYEKDRCLESKRNEDKMLTP